MIHAVGREALAASDGPRKSRWWETDDKKASSGQALLDVPLGEITKTEAEKGLRKRPREESNLRTRIRSPLLYPLSYGARGQSSHGPLLRLYPRRRARAWRNGRRGGFRTR